jgi:hypothetical protein
MKKYFSSWRVNFIILTSKCYIAIFIYIIISLYIWIEIFESLLKENYELTWVSSISYSILTTLKMEIFSWQIWFCRFITLHLKLVSWKSCFRHLIYCTNIVKSEIEPRFHSRLEQYWKLSTFSKRWNVSLYSSFKS